MKFYLLALCLSFPVIHSVAQTFRINEVMSSNGGVVTDSDGDMPDWIEFYNAGTEAVNLKGYGLSDKKSELFQWVFPDFTVPPKEYLLVFASGKDRRMAPCFWNTIIARGDQWKYIVPKTEPATNWRLINFNDASWQTGKSGFGFGDDDDETNLPVAVSVFIRRKFDIADPLAISQLVLHVDYDDGFVAYLNGVEIYRSNMLDRGDLPRFDALASDQHEAVIYQGYSPEKFIVPDPSKILKAGENVLAIQVHNFSATSSDLSLIPYLSVGTANQPVNPRVFSLLNLTTAELHTNFKINADGESIYLTDPSGSVADSVRIGSLPLNVSYGRIASNPLKWMVFTSSTPKKENLGSVLSGDSAGEPKFSLQGGVFSTTLKIALTAPDKNDTIYYTLDGSVPERSSSIATREIDIVTSKVLKARILKSGMLPGKTITNSYIIYSNKNLPIISISMNPRDLWDYNSGIYVNGPNWEAADPHGGTFPQPHGANYWMDWEKACHFEMMETTGNKVIDVDAGVKINGAWSRANAQKSMAFYCRKSYGDEFMKYKIFKERPFDEFKDLILRNSGNDWNQSMFRDGLMTGLTLGLNIDQQAFRPATIFLNGDYWGILNIREKINEDFIASNHGVDPDKVIMLELNGNPIAGSADDWWSLYNFIQQNTLSIQANYDKVVSQIDLDNFMNYFASEIYFRNHDWPGNNIKYWKTTEPGSRWRWIMHDTDFGMGIWGTSPTENSLAAATAPNGPGWPNPPWSTLILRRMLENQGFRDQFVNRFADLLNSTYLAERVNKAIDLKKNAIYGEMVNHLKKWNGGSWNDWLLRIQQMKSFATERPINVFYHIRDQFKFQNPQIVNVQTDSLAGSIQFNSLRLTKFPWRGAYFREIPVTLTAIPKAGYRFLKWEGLPSASTSRTINIPPATGMLLTAVFESDGSHFDDIVINEISFNNAATNDPGDWIEIYNKGNNDIDISGWKMTDSDPAHQFVFAANTVIKANGYLVVANDLTKMKAVFGSVKNLLEPYTFSFGLANTVDAVKLYSRDDQLIDEVNYKNSEPWQTYSLSETWSLELVDPAKNNNSGLNWTLSEKDGTPGMHNTPYIPDDVTDLTVDRQTTTLLQNYPNPFSDGTYIEFSLEKPGKYWISVLDVNGKIIRNIIGDDQLSTVHTLYWNGKDDSGKPVASGVYFYRLQCKNYNEMKRMVKM